MMLFDAPAQGRFQLFRCGAQPAVGQRGQSLRNGLTFDQGIENAPPAQAQDVGHHCVELDVGVLQRLLDVLNVAGALTH